MQVHLTMRSANAKTGPIPVSMTSAASCPTACPFAGMNGCYAEMGPVAIHWRKTTNGAAGTDWATFCAKIEAMPAGTLWRHNQAGDLPGDRESLNYADLMQLVRANLGKRGFTYTHYLLTVGNRLAIRECNMHGFTVNLSGNDLSHADELADANIAPVVVVLPADQMTNCTTPKGRKVVVCPAVTHHQVNCLTCKLCANAKREVIIGFPAHGTAAKKADAVARKFFQIHQVS